MSGTIKRSSVSSLQRSSDVLISAAEALANAKYPFEMEQVAGIVDLEIERLRTLVVMMRHDVKRDLDLERAANAPEMPTTLPSASFIEEARGLQG